MKEKGKRERKEASSLISVGLSTVFFCYGVLKFINRSFPSYPLNVLCRKFSISKKMNKVTVVDFVDL